MLVLSWAIDRVLPVAVNPIIPGIYLAVQLGFWWCCYGARRISVKRDRVVYREGLRLGRWYLLQKQSFPINEIDWGSSLEYGIGMWPGWVKITTRPLSWGNWWGQFIRLHWKTLRHRSCHWPTWFMPLADRIALWTDLQQLRCRSFSLSSGSNVSDPHGGPDSSTESASRRVPETNLKPQAVDRLLIGLGVLPGLTTAAALISRIALELHRHGNWDHFTFDMFKAGAVSLMVVLAGLVLARYLLGTCIRGWAGWV